MLRPYSAYGPPHGATIAPGARTANLSGRDHPVDLSLVPRGDPVGLEGQVNWVVTARKIRGPSTRCNRSEEHTSELQSRFDLVWRLLLEKKEMDAGAHVPVVCAAPGAPDSNHSLPASATARLQMRDF